MPTSVTGAGEQQQRRGRPAAPLPAREAGVRSSSSRSGAGADVERRERVLLRWYRCWLRELILPLLGGWERTLGVSVADWRIRRMKTTWGACNVDARRIWVTLELAKKPAQCLEYILVHELCHLLERHHTEGFTAIMDRHLPQWRSRRQGSTRAAAARLDCVLERDGPGLGVDPVTGECGPERVAAGLGRPRSRRSRAMASAGPAYGPRALPSSPGLTRTSAP